MRKWVSPHFVPNEKQRLNAVLMSPPTPASCWCCSSLKVYSDGLTSCLIKFEVGSHLFVQLSSFKPRSSTLDQSDVFLFLYFKPFSFSIISCVTVLSDISRFNVLLLRVPERCFFQSLFPHNKTFSPVKTATRHFYFFYFSKNLLSVHLSTLCNEPEHVKALLKNPENLQSRSDYLLRRPG